MLTLLQMLSLVIQFFGFRVLSYPLRLFVTHLLLIIAYLSICVHICQCLFPLLFVDCPGNSGRSIVPCVPFREWMRGRLEGAGLVWGTCVPVLSSWFAVVVVVVIVMIRYCCCCSCAELVAVSLFLQACTWFRVTTIVILTLTLNASYWKSRLRPYAFFSLAG